MSASGRRPQVAGLLLIVATVAAAENWPQWRGPHLNGSTTETNLPARWSQTENVAWAAPMPGRGAATPIVWGDRVFISSLGLEHTLRPRGRSRKAAQEQAARQPAPFPSW